MVCLGVHCTETILSRFWPPGLISIAWRPVPSWAQILSIFFEKGRGKGSFFRDMAVLMA